MAPGLQTTTGVFVRTPVQRMFIIFSYAVLVNRPGGGRYGRAQPASGKIQAVWLIWRAEEALVAPKPPQPLRQAGQLHA